MSPKLSMKFYKIGFIVLLIMIIIATSFSVYYLYNNHRFQKHEAVVAELVDKALETGDVGSLADTHFDPNIEIVYPPNFNLPPFNTNVVSGIDNVKTVVKTWKQDTEHKVDIVDIITEGNKVIVFADIDRAAYFPGSAGNL